MGSMMTAAMTSGWASKAASDGGDVVVGESEGEVGDLFRDAGGSGNAKGRDARAGFDQKAVGVAVIAAFKLDDDLRLVTARARRMADMVASVPELTNAFFR